MTVNIMIYTTPEVLTHKRRDGRRGEGRYCHWGLAGMPKRLRGIGRLLSGRTMTGDRGDHVKLGRGKVRLYFATGGFVRGYFDVHEIGFDMSASSLRFHSDTWTPVGPTPQRQFQEFKYLEGVLR